MSATLPVGAPRTARSVAILGAMRAEIAPLVARLTRPRRIVVGPGRAWAGHLGSTPVVVACTGEGAARAAAGAAVLLERVDPHLVIVVGIAGGLSPDLRPGALLVAREVRDEDSGAPPPDAAWVARVLRLGGAEAGTVLSTARILGSTAAKAAARARLAGDGPAAVDLESAAFARVAAARRAPYVVLRAVCDTAREELPVDLERCRDGSGAIRRLDVVRQAMLHPASALALWRLRQRLDDGARALARLVAALLVDAEAPR